MVKVMHSLLYQNKMAKGLIIQDPESGNLVERADPETDALANFCSTVALQLADGCSNRC